MKRKFIKGYIQIYTGDGKGKTTAALGLALRASGHGLRTFIAQFMKGQHYGELTAVMDNPFITIEQFGKDTFTHIEKTTPADVAMAQAGLAKAQQAMVSTEYDIIILDEINVAIHFQLLTIDEVLDFIKQKPLHVELIITGRKAPQRLIDIADLVTDMQEVKHYYLAGVPARAGIEK